MTNKGSSDKINYLIRPAKQVERKLIIEALQCLGKSYDVANYTYVGMGSRYFVDFQMVHKFLGISDMISFEKEEDKIRRFDFNRPYNFIDLKPGLSTEILPILDWSKDFVIWLDYDSKISPYMADDIKIICDNAKAGTILILTIDAEPKRFDDKIPKNEIERMDFRIKNLKKFIHPYYPQDLKRPDMAKMNFPKVLHKIVKEIVRDCLRFNAVEFFQVFNFIYEDTSQMYTYGCVFDEDGERLKETRLYDLKHISGDDNFIKIKLPILTSREKMLFDRLIPGIVEKLEEFEMSPEKLNTYEEYSRYYPQYFEVYI